MFGHVPLGSVIRIATGSGAIQGLLVGRLARQGGVPGSLMIETSGPEGASSLVVETASLRQEVEVLSEPAPGSMLITCHTAGSKCGVQHVLPSRVAAVEWLDTHHPGWCADGTASVFPTHPDTATWANPVPLKLVPSRESEGFRDMPEGTTGIPLGNAHPGAFGFRRRHHIHEGVDIYVPDGTPVSTVEAGTVVAILPFTGSIAVPPTPFWNDTWAVLVEGRSGTVVYGEIDPVAVALGDQVPVGTRVGLVRRVLIKEKSPPRPMSMLHIELHRHGTRDAYEWPVDGPHPESLLDPTEVLLSTCLHGPSKN
ncbi:peptidoglycan DD-metalloendopeptidase family protein [Sphingomonas sp. 3-13AW]|uniref:peptidoglycan DD-metalloendopeptidase family protein n=1 Tax=Sphingomonas sp. 3-13AW TaxID=3050450 RepID=UPI003BB791E5